MRNILVWTKSWSDAEQSSNDGIGYRGAGRKNGIINWFPSVAVIKHTSNNCRDIQTGFCDCVTLRCVTTLTFARFNNLFFTLDAEKSAVIFGCSVK